MRAMSPGSRMQGSWGFSVQLPLDMIDSKLSKIIFYKKNCQPYLKKLCRHRKVKLMFKLAT